MSGKKWSEHEESVVTDNYPDGGWEAVHELLPHRPRTQIQGKASLMGVKLSEHRGGTKKGGGKPKDDAECKPYPWPPLDAATLALQHFAYITHKGQLRPMVRVELEEAA
jgi:hypothetical protein